MRTRIELIWAEHQRELERLEEEGRARDRAFLERADRQAQGAIETNPFETNPSHWKV